jgi:antitoxin VapB
MATARVFQSGNSQAVRIPKEFRLQSKVVEIERRGEELVLREPRQSLSEAFRILTSMPKDMFPKGRQQPKMPKRKSLGLL